MHGLGNHAKPSNLQGDDMDDFGNDYSARDAQSNVGAMVRFFFSEVDGILDESTLAYFGMV